MAHHPSWRTLVVLAAASLSASPARADPGCGSFDAAALVGIWQRQDAYQGPTDNDPTPTLKRGKRYLLDPAPNGKPDYHAGYLGNFINGPWAQAQPFSWSLSGDTITEERSGTTYHERISCQDGVTMSQLRQEDAIARVWVRQTPKIDLCPSANDFGTLPVGSSSTAAFTVSNRSTADLTVTSVTFSGSGAGAFTLPGVVPAACGKIPARGVCTIETRFAPDHAGAIAATMTVASNDAAAPGVTSEVRGSGIVCSTPGQGGRGGPSAVSIDPLALIFPPAVYTKLVELRHPHEPRVADLKNALRSMSASERKEAIARASVMATQAKAVERAAAGVQ